MPAAATEATADIARDGVPAGAQGRVPARGHRQSEEAEFRREEGGQGAAEQREGGECLHPRRRYVRTLGLDWIGWRMVMVLSWGGSARGYHAEKAVLM